MEKIVNVSIGGVAFILESQAYTILKDYTVKIELGYRENPDGAEILSDIESRIGELILMRQGPEEVVPASLIREITQQLGLPDDLSIPDAKQIATELENEPEYKGALPRRLYRNPEGAKLGGVASGLGAYFDIDPVWLRLGFFMPLLLTPVFGILHMRPMAGFCGTMIGVFFMLYFVLWIIILKAKTPLQKLEMKGKKITASTIEREFYSDFSQKGDPVKSEKQASALTEVVYVIGKIILFCLKALLLIIGIGFGIAAVSMIVALIVALSGGYSWGFGASWMSPSEYTLIAILFALIFILPMLILGYLLFRTVFELPKKSKTLAIFSGIWVLILIFMSIFIARNIENIRSNNIHSPWDMLERWEDRWEDRFEDRWDDDRSDRRDIRMLSDTTYVETIPQGDSTVTDTVKVEYFTR